MQTVSLLSNDHFCRLCRTPVNPSQVWCDDLCRRWNEIMTTEMWWENKKPSQADWDVFCLKFYGETKPMLDW